MLPALTFIPGRPAVPCRPYTADELAAMRAATLKGVAPAAAGERPDAVIFSGMPGSGKSSLQSRLGAAGLLPRPAPQLARLDADVLRGFHAQLAAYARDASGVRYEDLVPWWLEGSRFEEAVFRAQGGLADALLSSRRSFVQPAVMHTPGNVSWVRHVVERFGYSGHLVLVHVPADVAVARATQRAYRTGRWCAPEYVRATEAGLLRHSAEVASICAASGGTVRLLDNAAENAAPDAVQLLAAPLSADVAEAYGLRGAMLSDERVRAFAAAQAARLPPGALAGVDCCIASGAFKCLLSVRGGETPQPRDLDLWPQTPRNEELLLARLSPAARAVRAGRWNTQLELISAADGASMLVEVVHAYGRDLDATLAQFDIALAAVGARLQDGVVTDVVVHPLALESVQRRELLLLPGAEASEHALSTAERLLRYARTLGWPRPERQLQQLCAAFAAAPPARRVAMVALYRAVTLDAADCAEVRRMFGITEQLWADGSV